MLSITVPETEFYDYGKEEFIHVKETHLQLEHSLLSLKKWEEKWHIPFLDDKPKTMEQTYDYIRCMTLTQNVPPEVYSALSAENLNEINAYIDNPMTATWFGSDKKRKSNRSPYGKRTVTAELIYYWMTVCNIPMECQKWHLNQLTTLIRICNEENAPKEKRKKGDMLRERRSLNEARKKALHTRG